MATISGNEFLGGKKAEVISSAIEQTSPAQTSQQSQIIEFGKGLAKGGLKTMQAAQLAGQGILAASSPSKTLSDVKKETGIPFLKNDFSASNSAQKAGMVTETIAEFLLPFGKVARVGDLATGGLNVAKKVAGKATDLAAKAPDKVAKAVLGEADTQIIKSGQNPMVDLFKTGKKRVSDVVNGVEQSIDSFVKDSKRNLQVIKDSIPEVDVGAQKIAEKINDGIMKSVQHSADYRGIKQGFETADDIINSGILKPEEVTRVQDVVEFVAKWKDTTARGTLNLKEALSNFYATGENYTGSNAIIRSMQRNLVDLVGDTTPEIRVALKTASKNIDKTEEFVQHLFGKDSASGESKILTLARNLADKAKNGYKVDLVKELEKVSGMKITDDLQGIYDYLQAAKLQSPGLQKPIETVRYVVKKAIEKGVKLK